MDYSGSIPCKNLLSQGGFPAVSHINDRTDREFECIIKDFSTRSLSCLGKVTYHIEGKAYHLKPQGHSSGQPGVCDPQAGGLTSAGAI